MSKPTKQDKCENCGARTQHQIGLTHGSYQHCPKCGLDQGGTGITESNLHHVSLEEAREAVESKEPIPTGEFAPGTFEHPSAWRKRNPLEPTQDNDKEPTETEVFLRAFNEYLLVCGEYWYEKLVPLRDELEKAYLTTGTVALSPLEDSRGEADTMPSMPDLEAIDKILDDLLDYDDPSTPGHWWRHRKVKATIEALISDRVIEARIDELERQQATNWTTDQLYHGKGTIKLETLMKINNDRIQQIKGGKE